MTVPDSRPTAGAPRAGAGSPAGSTPAGAPDGATDPAAAVARALLYEGYVLWPYRRSARKNQRRWTFGGVHPRAWSEDGHSDDAWWMCAECLVERGEADGAGDPTVEVGVRFLQVVERRVARWSEGAMRFADRIDVGGEAWTAWEEAREREVTLPPLPLRAGAEAWTPIAVWAASEREWLQDAGGSRAAAVVRSWGTLAGTLAVRCESVGGGVVRVRAEVSNATEWSGEEREDVLRSTFASTHLFLRARHAAFVSLTDPPPGLEAAAAACGNRGCWPVLVGERGARDRMLASPIILPDYPVVAPESPGDFFDGGEIDEMLTLHVLALSDREKEEMRATDPRTRRILERTSALAAEQILSLHGTFRDGRTGDPLPAPSGSDATEGASEAAAGAGPASGGSPGPEQGLAEDAPDPFWVEMGRPPAGEIVVEGLTLRRGSRVRLHPAPGGDVMDMALAGRTAIVEEIDEDDAGGVHFTVVVEGDPGLDLGMARMPGHRFFFRPEEIEPLGEDADAPPGAVGRRPDEEGAEPPAGPQGGSGGAASGPGPTEGAR